MTRTLARPVRKAVPQVPVRPRHLEHLVDNAVVAVSEPGQRARPGDVHHALGNQRIVYMDADNRPERDPRADLQSLHRVEGHGLQVAAFERHGGFANARGIDFLALHRRQPASANSSTCGSTAADDRFICSRRSYVASEHEKAPVFSMLVMESL